MEQKKTLWIVAASGVFLLVVAGAALLLSLQKTGSTPAYENPADGWIYPSQAQAQAPVYPSQPQNPPAQTSQDSVQPLSQTEFPPSSQPQTDYTQTEFPSAPSEYAATAGSENNLSENPMNARNVTVITDNALVYGTGTTTTIDLNTLKSNPVAVSSAKTASSAAQSEAQNVASGSKTVSTPEPAATSQTSSAVDTAVDTAIDTSRTPAKTAVTAKKTETSSKTSATSQKNAAQNTAAQKTASKTASTTKKAAPKATAYWIQVGSYEAKKSADEARTILENNKIPNEVFTYTDTKGKLFYRVRVGPYTTKSEAEYWQKRIASTDEFAKTGSYIVQN